MCSRYPQNIHGVLCVSSKIVHPQPKVESVQFVHPGHLKVGRTKFTSLLFGRLASFYIIAPHRLRYLLLIRERLTYTNIVPIASPSLPLSINTDIRIRTPTLPPPPNYNQNILKHPRPYGVCRCGGDRREGRVMNRNWECSLYSSLTHIMYTVTKLSMALAFIPADQVRWTRRTDLVRWR